MSLLGLRLVIIGLVLGLIQGTLVLEQLLYVCGTTGLVLMLRAASPWPLSGAMGWGLLDGIGAVGGSLCVFL